MSAAPVRVTMSFARVTREIAIAGVFLLLIGRDGILGSIAGIHFRVVGGRLRDRWDRDHRTDPSEHDRVNGPSETVLMHLLTPLRGRDLLGELPADTTARVGFVRAQLQQRVHNQLSCRLLGAFFMKPP
jgi:hypothetical protein